MYRALVMFPASVDATAVDRLVERDMASAFGRADGFLSMAVSVGPLMGPSARSGEYRSIVCVDFHSLDAALGAIESDDFSNGKAESEAMGAQIYLFEVAAV
jgi:hypothetical protein